MVKKKRGSLQPYAKLNIFIIVIILAVTASLSIGYSILSKNLNVSTQVLVKTSNNIRVNSISQITTTNNAYELYDAKYYPDSFKTSVGLSQLDSTASYKLTIKNYNSKTMYIKEINVTGYDNDDIEYDLSGIKVGDVVESSGEISFTITYKYKDGIAVLPDNKELNALFEFVFEEYKLDYISDMSFDLRGVDMPLSNGWIDRINSQKGTITNTTYDSNNKMYTFNGNSYISFSNPVLPEKTNFTLEILLKTGDSFNTSLNQTILSQASSSIFQNKFSLNIKYISNRYDFNTSYVGILGINSSTIYTNVNLSPATIYDLQMVRNGNKMQYYINNQIILNVDFSIDISQRAMVLGMYTNSNYFKGSIYAVRLYNRTLTTDELNNNYQVDQYTYFR